MSSASRSSRGPSRRRPHRSNQRQLLRKGRGSRLAPFFVSMTSLFLRYLAVAALAGLVPGTRVHAEATPREVIAKALIADTPEEQVKLVSSLVGQSDPAIPPLLAAWKESTIYLYEPVD